MLRLVTPPAVPAVAAETVWDYLRLDTFHEADVQSLALVDQIINAAIGEIDGASMLLGRALITQKWELRLDWSFPGSAIELPLPPCQSVESIEYIGPDGNLTTLDPTLYDAFGLRSLEKAEIAPAYSKSWPATRSVREAVVITFIAGFGDAPDDVPAAIRGALLETISTRFLLRESVRPDGHYAMMPRSAQDVLDRYRVGLPIR